MSKPDAAGDKPVIRPAARSSAGDMNLCLRMWFFKGGRSLQIGNSLVSGIFRLARRTLYGPRPVPALSMQP
ncbi:hypothetical protein B5K08_00575 [Rhizobium leguminosarum bv. trifolii]|uniref:Uncharacterized protein n=1 Tax=Rhizobium leguminosarum bv. trifolii TaxID=386 RepID=A0A3E1BZD3_RHILT|nr:hypothetical protein B5K08_00575 [Rhizobium leguminosarum bv. trifolii]RFC00862.1 hypothetical protein B5K10_00575 [Rhizobium leguminosarum bv. trifolii]